jgi:uncharacterized membrane protein YqgA involved in biofilm formation
MWIIKFLPDWIFYAILVAGTIGLLISRFMPPMYKTAVQVGSLVAFVFGVFMAGAIHDNAAWVERVEAMKAKVAEAEAKGKEETVRIETKVVTKTEVIKQKAQVVKQYIDREITKYDNQCVIPKEFVKAHNDAAEAPVK